MSIKFPKIAKFFSGVSTETQTEKKSGLSTWFGLFSRNSEQKGPKDSRSIFERLFAKLSWFTEKTKNAADTVFPDSPLRDAAAHHVKSSTVTRPDARTDAYDPALQKPFPAEMNAADRWSEIAANTLPPSYIDFSEAAPPAQTSVQETVPPHASPDEQVAASARFIKSSAGRLQIDLVDMATLIDNNQSHARIASPGSAADTLIHAFQIYYEEEGKQADPEKLVSPDWRARQTATSPEALTTLSDNLKRVPTGNQRDRDLIQKALASIQTRIEYISRTPQKNKTLGP